MKYVERTEEGDIILKPGEFIGENASNGLPITSVTLSRMGTAIHWLIEFLNEKEDVSDSPKSGCRVYRATRTPDAVLLEEVRDGGLVNVVKFSSEEVRNVLEELRQVMAEESAKEE
jgi:hypothetical protein